MGAMEYFEYTFDLPLDDKRNANIGDKPLPPDQRFVPCLQGILQVCDMQYGLFYNDLTCQAFTQANLGRVGLGV